MTTYVLIPGAGGDDNKMKAQFSMRRMNYLAVLVSAVAAFVVSSVWYTVFANAWMELRGIGPATEHGGGHDDKGRNVRYLQWALPPEPA